MDPSILHDYYFSSYQNYSDFKTGVYTVEINGISNRMDLIELFKKYDFTHEKRKIKMTGTKDKKYVKLGSTIKVSKVLFSTKTPLLLQQGVSLLGYCLKNINENVKEEDWGDDDDDNDEREIVRLKAEEQDFYSRHDMNFYIARNKLVLEIHFFDFSYLIELLNMFLKMIYTDFMYILTQEKEDRIKKCISAQPNKYTYLFANKREKSVLIKNYFYTIPCIRINTGGDVFLLDTYHNLKKVGETSEPDYFYNEQGFSYSSNHFVSIENEVQFNYELERGDALVYYNHEMNTYEIYTRSVNIYTDEIVDGVFTRKNYMKDVLDILYLFFSKVAMSKESEKYVKKVIATFRMKAMVKRFCKNLDIDYLVGLSDSYKKIILNECKKNKDWLSLFFTRFLTYKYDESKPIIINLSETPNNVSDKTITSIHLSLEKELNEIRHKSFRNQDYHDTVVKFLDQMKFYSKELEKRVHIRGSITNAWMKCWEMIHTFKLVPLHHDNTFTIFCNAEFPGAFVLAFNHYIKTYTKNKKYEWYANSIWPTEELKKRNKEIYKDSFKLYEKYPHRWLMNEKNGGDVSKINMIDIIEERLKHKVDLYTSDVAEDETHSNIILGQFLCGLKVLKNGGTMVCRMSTFFKPFSMSLLFLLTTMFSDVCITKPMASRAICSECYIIGKNYTSNPFIINQLETVLINWTDDSVNTFIEPITEDFYVKLVYASYYIYDREIHFLKKNMEMTETMYNKNKDIKSIGVNTILQADQKEFEFRKGIIEHWKTMFKVPYLPKEDDI